MKEGHACQTTFQFKPKLKPTDMDHILVDNTAGVHYLVGDDDEDPTKYRVRKVHCINYYGRGQCFEWRDCGILRAVAIAEENDETVISKDRIIARGIVDADDMLFTWTRDMHDF